MARKTIWQAIDETLSAEIAAGHYPPGARLPTEAALATRFGVNRHTVRHALAALAARGLVHARRGAGVFVTARPVDYPIGRRVRFHQSLAAAGQLPDKTILRRETRPADVDEAEALALAPGAAVHVNEGVSLADGLPIALFRSVFPAARFPTLPADLEATRSVTAALARGGVRDYTRAETRVSARAATPTQALHLQIAAGAPLLRTVAVNVDPEGRPVEHGTTWFVGERLTLTVTPEG